LRQKWINVLIEKENASMDLLRGFCGKNIIGKLFSMKKAVYLPRQFGRKRVGEKVHFSLCSQW
jgi:hypothetical protein